MNSRMPSILMGIAQDSIIWPLAASSTRAKLGTGKLFSCKKTFCLYLFWIILRVSGAGWMTLCTTKIDKNVRVCQFYFALAHQQARRSSYCGLVPKIGDDQLICKRRGRTFWSGSKICTLSDIRLASCAIIFPNWPPPIIPIDGWFSGMIRVVIMQLNAKSWQLLY